MTWRKRTTLAALASAGVFALLTAGGCEARAPSAAGCAGVSRPSLIAQSAAGRIRFDGGLASIALAPACDGSLAERVRPAEGRRFLLLVDDLRAREPSGAVFTLRLSETSGDSLMGETSVLGTLNFFAANTPAAPGPHRSVSYDVTRAVRALAATGRLGHGLVVMLEPSEPPAPGAELSVGRLQLVAQSTN